MCTDPVVALVEGLQTQAPQCSALFCASHTSRNLFGLFLLTVLLRFVPPCVTCSPSVVSLRGPGQSLVCSSPHDAALIFS